MPPDAGRRAAVCSALRVDLDPDVALCEVLMQGAPTEVRKPIPLSGVCLASVDGQGMCRSDGKIRS